MVLLLNKKEDYILILWIIYFFNKRIKRKMKILFFTLPIKLFKPVSLIKTLILNLLKMFSMKTIVFGDFYCNKTFFLDFVFYNMGNKEENISANPQWKSTVN